MKTSSSKGLKAFSQSARTGILLVVVAALTLEATSLIQYYYTEKGLEEEATKRAETQLEATRNEIMSIIGQAETAVRNSVWIAQWCLDYPDSLPRVCQRIVQDNPVIVGSTVAIIPERYAGHPLYAPYVHRVGDSLALTSLATPEYDYPSQEWFVKPLELKDDYWSEPYVDTGGGDILMTTFSRPIEDRTGHTSAVLTADLSLEWLTEVVGNIRVYPNAHSLIISRTGRFMVSKDRELVMQKTIVEVVDQIRDNADFQELNRAMLAGESGKIVLTFEGRKSHVFYAPVERTGWSMCIVVPEHDIYQSIRRTSALVKLLQLLGLLMLILILRSFYRNQKKYKELDERRERMQGELRIASGIQMSMVPKVFPPFPERHDLDMAATIVPAKEVGGDLYDFFIRDEKLFFGIGDVSGKGIPASLVMAVTRTSFRNVAAQEDSPGRIVTLMNDSLSAMNENSMFVTFFCGVLDLKNGSLRYCNAGHNPPLTLTDAIRTLPVIPNLPLGIVPGLSFVEQETVFSYDDALFLYTDGLSEAENVLHEQFGEERMKEALHGKKFSQDHLENIKAKVSDFVGDAPQSDDLTMLFIHYLPAAHRLTLTDDIGQISLLPGFVDAVDADVRMDPGLKSKLNLALEEAVANVILYAYPGDREGRVDIDAFIGEGRLTFLITDSGVPFDPTAKADPDLSAGVEERPIGGLGIHLVRTIMDTVSYERRGEKNILTLTINI